MLAFDQRLFLWLNEALSGDGATWFFGTATWLGNGFVLALLIMPLMAWRDRDRFRRQIVPMVLSVTATGLVVLLAKSVIGRERPPLWAATRGIEVHIPFGVPGDGSMPSGHAQTAFGAAMYLSLLYPRWTPGFLALGTLVGMSRVALGVHFPSDVMVGAVTGAAGSCVAFWLNRRRGLQR